MNIRRQLLMMLTAVSAAVITIILLRQAEVGNTLLTEAGICSAAAVLGLLRIPGKPYWVQILICWGVTLFLYLLGMNIEEAVSGTHPYLGNLMGFLMVFILPPLLLIEALVIWLLGTLRRQAATAAARHDQFLAAVTAGDLDRVKALLPDIYINDTNKRGETAIQLAVLAATDTIHPQQGDTMQIVQLLLQNGADASGCLNAMVEQHELYFEATDQHSSIYSAAVSNATALIPKLAAAGDTISKEALDSARYNCDPTIQQALQEVPVTPSELPEE